MEQRHLESLTYFISVIPVPSAPPENVSAEAVSSTQILLTWSAVPESEQNGLILGYKVRYWSFMFTSLLKHYLATFFYLLFIAHLRDVNIIHHSTG